MFRIASRLAFVSAVFALLVACIEDFERLTTTVDYDPVTRTLTIERVLHNIDADFFACHEAAECAKNAARMAKLDVEEPPPAEPVDPNAVPPEDPSWKALTKGILESKAYDIAVRYVRTGDQLDAVVTYHAAADSKAATDAGVLLETLQKGKKTTEYLVVNSDPGLGGLASSAPAKLLEPEGAAVRTIGGESPIALWVLGKKQHHSVVDRFVDESAQPIFVEVPGLDEALKGAGLL